MGASASLRLTTSPSQYLTLSPVGRRHHEIARQLELAGEAQVRLYPIALLGRRLVRRLLCDSLASLENLETATSAEPRLSARGRDGEPCLTGSLGQGGSARDSHALTRRHETNHAIHRLRIEQGVRAAARWVARS